MSRKTLTLVTIVLLVISLILAVYTWFFTGTQNQLKESGGGALDPLFYWTYLLFIVAAILAIVMPIPALLKNPKALKRTLIGIAGIVVLFIIVYLLSSGTPSAAELSHVLPSKQDGYIASSTVANMNLIGVYIMLGLAIIAIIWSVVKDFVSK